MSREHEYEEIDVYVKNINGKKKKGILGKIFLFSLLVIIVVAIIFIYNVNKNGGGIKGIVTTVVGSNAEKTKQLEDVYILLLGKSGNLTDTIMVSKYSPKNQVASLLSIPRDTFVGKDKDKASAFDKINSKYYNGGAKLVLKEVNELTGLNIKYYLTVDTEALKELVDAIGGIEFDVPIDMDYDDVTQDLHIHIKKGPQKLNGEQAEGVVRFRKNNDYTTYPSSYGDNDIGRMRTQREFLTVLLKQLMQPQNLTKINKMLEIAQKRVETNVEWDAIKDYIPALFDFKTENLVTNALPGYPAYANKVAVYFADKDKTKKIVNEMFLDIKETKKEEETSDNTVKKEVIDEKLKDKKLIKIQLINGTGTTIKFSEIKNQLKKQGYTITETKESSIIDNTVIINRTNQEARDIEALKALIGSVGYIQNKPAESKYDLTIIVGRDY